MSTGDSQVATIIKKHLDRAEKGYHKYGCNTDRVDLTPAQWLDHLIEELMDATIYTQRLHKAIQEFQDQKDNLDKILTARINRCVEVEKAVKYHIDNGSMPMPTELTAWYNKLGKPS